MPVILPTTFGKTDYNVVLALKNLTSAVNTLEQTVATLGTATGDIAGLKSATGTLQSQVATLTQQVRGLLTP